MNKSILNRLSERWNHSGIERGDIVLLHSDIRRMLFDLKSDGLKLDIKLIIDSFIDCIGPNGTLIMPLFNFGFANGETFDINSTPSKMGILTEFFRKNFKIIRTGHPIYSFGVIGKEYQSFLNLDNYSGYANDSPFGLLKRLNGKIAILDLEDQNSMTFYHHVEEINNVDYRYFKKFSGNYIDKKFNNKKKTYCLFVRNLELGIKTYVNPAGELLWKEGLYKGDKPFINSGLRTIKCNELFDFISQIIKSGNAENILYRK
jgi:aminoglycoside 3-N-acetyltransferase